MPSQSCLIMSLWAFSILTGALFALSVLSDPSMSVSTKLGGLGIIAMCFALGFFVLILFRE